MESYKHSCPFCGQHIEYTVEYCGMQMVCPSCGKSITFPAIPPGGKRQSLHIKRETAARAEKWSFNLNGILTFLREFEHWNMVLMGLVPFIIVGALLVGASVLRKNGNGPAVPVAPVVQADPNAWQQMTNLARADQSVQQQLNNVAMARAAVAAAERTRAHCTASFYNSADQALTKAQQGLVAAQKSFENAFQNYQQLGGTVDYRRQLPQ
jgi:hypothetical protein